MADLRIKRHARLGGPTGRLLWVGDETDWQSMRAVPQPTLVCPQSGCGDRLHPVSNSRGTRFLRRRSGGGGGGCSHWWVTSSSGGLESARHLWLKARLVSICLQLGWGAVPEDPVTWADVWVPDARAALEVQLRRTDTLLRTDARLRAGAATVVWFIAAEVPGSTMLFKSPSVRFDVVDSQDPSRSVEPWAEPAQHARLVVFATVWRWRDWRLVTGRVSAYSFLADLLSGRLGWCPPGTPGLPQGRGGWVRWNDLALALGQPDLPADELRSDAALAQTAWLDEQLARRRRSLRS